MLPKELYENFAANEQIITEGNADGQIDTWVIKKLTYGSGIELWVEGADYPQKGFAPPEAVWANNIVKRVLIKGVELVNPLRSFDKIITNFTDIAHKVMNPYFLKYQYLTAFSQEIHDLTLTFTKALGVEDYVASNFAKVCAHLFEYDNAYRLRAEDLFQATTKEKLLSDPRGEIKRLISILAVREQMGGVTPKFEKLAGIMTMLLVLPKIRQAYTKALTGSNFTKLQLDEVDQYWGCHRTDYNFMGLTYEERGELLVKAGLRRVEGKKQNI